MTEAVAPEVVKVVAKVEAVQKVGKGAVMGAVESAVVMEDEKEVVIAAGATAEAMVAVIWEVGAALGVAKVVQTVVVVAPVALQDMVEGAVAGEGERLVELEVVGRVGAEAMVRLEVAKAVVARAVVETEVARAEARLAGVATGEGPGVGVVALVAVVQPAATMGVQEAQEAVATVGVGMEVVGMAAVAVAWKVVVETAVAGLDGVGMAVGGTAVDMEEATVVAKAVVKGGVMEPRGPLGEEAMDRLVEGGQREDMVVKVAAEMVVDLAEARAEVATVVGPVGGMVGVVTEAEVAVATAVAE